MIKADVTYLSRPKGNVIFTCADSNYFKLFGEELVKSIERVVGFDCLHIHVINPDDEALSELNNMLAAFGRLSASVESMDTETLVNASRSAGTGWLKSMPPHILKMLAIEPLRERYLRRMLVKGALKVGVRPWRLISEKWLQSDSLRVYYACRRFSFIQEFFHSIEGLLVVDIDSVFKNDLFIADVLNSEFVLASKRSGSWSTHLAGFVFYPNSSEASNLINLYSEKLNEYLDNGWIFWGLDQFLLDVLAKHQHISELPESIFGLSDEDAASFISYKGGAKFRKRIWPK